MSAAELLRNAARRHGSRPAIEYLGHSLTYEQLNKRTDRIAAAVRRCGLRAGDRWLLFMPNQLAFVEALFAGFKAGLVVVREEGQHRYYSLDPSPLADIDDWILPFLDAEVPESAASLPEPAVNAAEFVGRAAASAKHAVESVWRRLPGVN